MLTFLNVLQVTYSRGYLNTGHAAAGPFMQRVHGKACLRPWESMKAFILPPTTGMDVFMSRCSSSKFIKLFLNPVQVLRSAIQSYFLYKLEVTDAQKVLFLTLFSWFLGLALSSDFLEIIFN
jgi:hypothetical protein